jgi:hypothetical protein
MLLQFSGLFVSTERLWGTLSGLGVGDLFEKDGLNIPVIADMMIINTTMIIIASITVKALFLLINHPVLFEPVDQILTVVNCIAISVLKASPASPATKPNRSFSGESIILEHNLPVAIIVV